MFWVLVVLFIVMPIAELAVLVTTANAIGVPETIALLIVVSVVGAWLCKRSGISVLRRIQDTLNRGDIPANELIDGFLVLLAGALMLTPGFITDVFAILLLLPPSRAVARGLLMRRFRTRIERYTVRGSRADFIDVEWHTERPPSRPAADPFELNP
jgi:UPF0716 protein FxsA